MGNGGIKVNESGVYINKTKNCYVLNLTNFLFYFAYTLLFVKEIILDRTRIYELLGSNIVNYLSLLCHVGFWCICIFIILFMQRYTIRELLVVLALLAFFILSVYSSKIYVLFDALLLVICSKKIDFDRYIKYSFYIQTACVCFTILLSLSGLIGQGVFVRGYDGTIRYALGFNHPNTLALLVFQWVCQYLYLKKDNAGIKRFIFASVLTLATYVFTDSNTGFIMTIIIIVCDFIYEKLFNKLFGWNIMKRIIKTVLFVGSIVLICVIRYYWVNPDKLEAQTLMARINLAKKYLTAYGINLFGQQVVSGNDVIIPGFQRGYYFLDNAYAWLLINIGVVVTVCIVVGYVLYIKNLLRNKNWNLIIAVTAYLIYALSERTTMMIVFNSLLVGFGSVVYKKFGQTDNKNEGINNE